jgi:hypothetical protein
VRIPKVFISYSWDNSEHEEWVMAFANELRQKGVDATIDKFITQQGTMNLNRMMLESIKESDYTIIVMTPNYTDRADEFIGGVGLESQLLLNFIQNEPSKIIPVLRSSKEMRTRAVPFYLKGFEYIDFSDSKNFEDRMNDILHKIFKVDKYKKLPIGGPPDLKSREVTMQTIHSDDDELIPNLRSITDLDKMQFMNDSYLQILKVLEEIMNATKIRNSNFDFVKEDITSKKSVFRIYINGNQRRALKIWQDSMMGSGQYIFISYDAISISNDSSHNESIMCEIKNNTLSLKPLMGFNNNYESYYVEGIAKGIWKSIVPYLT